ncbi:hypothetical protein SELMODRAFT_407501 [Selaginella moellendorffii]|uniref:F-box domain-containing protein n=1 Tax=Selaginella moellendorffii TaxID=88036 RepID=D8R5T7_SELML|nr:uncharacterized protein LOC9652306 [Selaginella moellendorffii]EFJ32211.1 hypothetical protein SELMODRAFT_407501 [Selaginella moellendorffii]|eukprot:XP_002966184.1 uncharacterized protein LOC9652306 [Selaginella moellendorffii]
MDWSALPLDVFLQIFRYHALDFLFLLAISGVCKTWRAHTAWIGTLVVRWPPVEDRPQFDNQGVMIQKERRRICGNHGVELHLCDCVHGAISSVIARFRKVWYLDLCCTEICPRGPTAVQVAKLRDADWAKVVKSLLHLELAAGVVDSRAMNHILQCSDLRELRLVSFEFADGLEYPLLGDAGEFSSSSGVLENLCRLYILTSSMQEEALKRFLERCPEVEEIELNACGAKSEREFNFEAPTNLHDYDLKLTSFSRFKRVRAAGARRLEILGGQLLILEEAECVEELAVLPVYIEFAEPEAMKNFWRLTLKGSFWEVHEAMSACQTAPTTKRLCLDDDFGVYFFPYVQRDENDDSVECYKLFSLMFRGGSLEELELKYGFLCRMWLNEQQEELSELLPKMPKIEILVLDLHVRPEKEPNIPRFADSVESLISSCNMDWISLSFGGDNNEDVNFHRECFDKELFSSVVQNVVRHGNPGPCPEDVRLQQNSDVKR